MAHKATLPHFALPQAHPLTAGEKLFWRRFLVGLLIAIVLAVIIIASPLLLSTAVALGAFDGWDSPIIYD